MNKSPISYLSLDIFASLDELLEIPFFVVDHAQSIVDGEDGHARGVAFIQHVGQKLGRQQKILGPETKIIGMIMERGSGILSQDGA